MLLGAVGGDLPLEERDEALSRTSPQILNVSARRIFDKLKEHLIAYNFTQFYYVGFEDLQKNVE